MVHGIWENDIPRTSGTIAKVANILKELANTINMNEQSEYWVQKPRNRIPTTKWHHGMLLRIKARIITLGTQNMARLLGDTLDIQGHNNSSNIYVEAIQYLNSLISMVNLAQRDIENRRKGFANASNYLETWDDSGSITAVNAQKDLRQSQNGGITTQHHSIKVPRPTMNRRKQQKLNWA